MGLYCTGSTAEDLNNGKTARTPDCKDLDRRTKSGDHGEADEAESTGKQPPPAAARGGHGDTAS